MKNWIARHPRILFFAWLFVTLLIVINNALFQINELVSSPQHGLFDTESLFDQVSALIQAQSSTVFHYKAFFLLDALWAPITIVLIGYFIRFLNEVVLLRSRSYTYSMLDFYYVIACIGLIFDWLEGYHYWFYEFYGIQFVMNAKVVCYVIALGFVFYGVLKKYILPNFRDIFRFAETSILSLLFILIVYALITFMPQGGTLVVDLFYNWWNIIILFALLTFLTLIISHFPTYVDIWRYGNTECVTLEMQKQHVFGWGLIYYYPTKKGEDTNQWEMEQKKYNRPLVKKMRRSLGILLYVAVFGIMIDVATRFFEYEITAIGLSFLILVMTLWVYDQNGKRYNRWRATLKGTGVPEAAKAATVHEIIAYVKWFPAYFLFATACVIFTALMAAFYDWSRVTVVLFMITLGLQMFLYVYFKLCRTHFKYVFFNDPLYKAKKEMFTKTTLQLYEAYDPKYGKRANRLQRFVGRLSDNLRYLNLMRVAGITSFITILIANFSFTFTTWLNPIVIILLYIIFFYSAIIITFKHVVYYHRKYPTPSKEERQKSLEEGYNKSVRKAEFFKYGIPVLTFILVVMATFFASKPNDLHELNLIDRKEPPMDYQEFFGNLVDENPQGKQNYFFVGSYGGGLKANLWNLVLLSELERVSQGKFLERTAVLSGVSGGAVGIGNYASLLCEQEGYANIQQRITQIGTSNVLSNELTYLLGKDWIREYLPFFKYKGQDRSFKSMQLHAKHTGMDSIFNEVSYTDYWKKLYDSKKQKFPLLIMNTTAVRGGQGVSSTVSFPKNTFPGALEVNKFSGQNKNKDLTFFGAISTTNRFPFLSPTAKIPGKGSFLDGGYFDNSGMLTVLEVYNTISRDSDLNFNKRINPIFINIINSQDIYIVRKMKDWGITPKANRETGEIGAVIGTITDIDKLIRYTQGKILKTYRDEVCENNIMMPHKITYRKVKQVLNAEVDQPLRLMDSIDAHNRLIDSVLNRYPQYNYQQWGVVEPPLARLLSLPAVEYQKAMVSMHPEVQKAIARINNLYIKTDTIETRKTQDRVMEVQQQAYQKNAKKIKISPKD
ncbi:hypothetical protein [Altibacter sp. HG106]|uniref:hypothetical protein n=1 Tax=Altibacter sp. HG106 TaxID=3023937 RepID=UPI0023502382|nr:hypothetical protein [Altibacter sp. HG106]MDC7993918.1 hypothetical protein [Altibacter sp. HG106]